MLTEDEMKKLGDISPIFEHLTTQKALPHTPLLHPPPLLASNG